KRPGGGRPAEPVSCREQNRIGMQGPRPVEAQREPAAIIDAGRRYGVDDLELDVRPSLDGLEEALAHIFAEKLARQESMGERFIQACMIFALIELAKGPIQEVARLAGANREIAGAHVEKMQWMMRAIGDAAPERGARLHHGEAKRPVDAGKARDGRRRAGE